MYNKSVTRQSVTKQKLFGKADTLIDKILSCSGIKFSNSQTIYLDGVDSGVLMSDFSQHLRQKNADVPGIYLTLLNAAVISSSLAFDQNAKAKDRGSWDPFKV